MRFKSGGHDKTFAVSSVNQLLTAEFIYKGGAQYSLMPAVNKSEDGCCAQFWRPM